MNASEEIVQVDMFFELWNVHRANDMLREFFAPALHFGFLVAWAQT